MNDLRGASRATASSLFARMPGCLALATSVLAVTACGSSTSGPAPASPASPVSSYTVGGTISGLTADGLVLANHGATLPVSANANDFRFAGLLDAGTAYAVTLQSAPSGLTCSVANGSGSVGTANVSDVIVSCTDQSFTLGGTISGLSTSGLVLANGTDRLSVAAAATSFTLPAAVAFSSRYAVTVAAQPQGLSCAVTGGTGAMPAAVVSGVSVSCSAQSYTLGGTVSGLITTGLVLANGMDTVTLPVNATRFTLPTPVAFDASYAVTVASQPANMTCTVVAGSGTMPAANVTAVAVLCAYQTHALGGTISALSASGLILTNGTDRLSVAAAVTTFSMPTGVAYSTNYAVTVAAQPAGLTCSVVNGAGTMPAADVSNVQVACVALQWIWEGGAKTVAVRGVYGTQGTPAAGNMPGARDSAMNWSDGAGRLWLFGGSGYGAAGSSKGDLDDVWSYDPSTQQWTWMSGLNTIDGIGVYGTQGVAAVGNLPSARHSAVTWTDRAGHLWLFSGFNDSNFHPGSAGTLNDLWSFDPSTTRWTWVSGSTTANAAGVYGSLGIAAPGQVPRSRVAANSWIDGAGHLWVFGGGGNDPDGGNGGPLNDLWSFDPGTQQWTWMSGSTTINAIGVYGTLGVAAAGNVPGARTNAVSWLDATGHLWLFGGGGYDSAGSPGLLNDLWSFDPGTQQWTWVSGSNTITATGIYGTLGLAATAHVPGARHSAVTWTDSAGRLWLFSGFGQDSAGNGTDLNDLWSFDPNTLQWTWVKGSSTGNTNGVYGTLGVAAPSNSPGARLVAAGSAWIDSADHLWVFGGYGRDSNGSRTDLNDLWKY